MSAESGRRDLWNRLAVSLVALFVLTGAIVTLLVAVDLLSYDFLPYRWLEPELQGVANSQEASFIGILAVASAVGLGALLLFFFELMPLARRGVFLVSSGEEGRLTIEASSLELLAEKTGLSSRGVQALRCTVNQRDGALTIRCHALMTLASNVPELGSEVKSRIKGAVEELAGLPVHQVDIKAKYITDDSRRVILP